MSRQRVLLGLSGGVDSALAAVLLKEDYEVHALWLDTGAGGEEDARRVAESLDLPFARMDVREELELKVCRPFAADYLAGRTPLPCALCNPTVKFPALLKGAEAVGADYIATGHYARTAEGLLYRGCPENDQSYLLSRLPKSILERCIFPLGGYPKDLCRVMAKSAGLSVAEKPDSMEICFVPDDDYAAWLERRGATPPPGDFVDPEGRVLGRHKGIHHYTLGQRRGLGVPAAHRLFVSRIDPERNTVTLSDGGDLSYGRVLCHDPNWIALPELTGPRRVSVRLRHSRTESPGTVSPLESGGVLVELDQPGRAPTPGQLAVFYDGELILGSAWIHGAE